MVFGRTKRAIIGGQSSGLHGRPNSETKEHLRHRRARKIPSVVFQMMSVLIPFKIYTTRPAILENHSLSSHICCQIYRKFPWLTPVISSLQEISSTHKIIVNIKSRPGTLVIGHDYLHLPESIFTYVYYCLKKLQDITFVSAGLFTLQYTTAGLQCCQLQAEVSGQPVEKFSLILPYRYQISDCINQSFYKIQIQYNHT